MKHLLLRWATCISFITCLAFSAKAEADFIYIVGHDNYWERPCTDNADFFAERKLFETSPGSKVYEGNFYFAPRPFFRFVSELSVAENPDDYSVYKKNVIAPCGKGDVKLDVLGKSGLYCSSVVSVMDFCPPEIEPGTWTFTTGSNNYKQFKVVVNLNDNKIFLVPVSTDYTPCLVVVPESMAVPTLDSAADYISASDYLQYWPAGKVAFNFYDFSKDEWWNSNSDTPLTNGYNYLNYAKSTQRGVPFATSSWNGGVVSTTSPTVVKLSEDNGEAVKKDVIYVHRSSDNFTPWDGASEEVLANFDALQPDGEGNYTGTINVSGGEKFNLISQLGSSQEANKVLSPSADRNIEFRNLSGLFYSSAVEANQADGAYWVVPYNLSSNKLTVTVTPGDNPVVKCAGEKGKPEIYLIGAPQGWSINDDSMPLKETVNGGYYGSYYIAAGEALFRFYKSLGSWDNIYSIGSQYEDSVLEFGNVEQETEFRLTVGGKGSFQFSDWPGGVMYMYVDVDDSKVTFSTSPIAAAGEFINYDNISPKGLESLYDENGMELNGKDGVYTMRLNVNNESNVVKLYTYCLPISRDEAEAEGSYALTLPDGFEWKFDEMGVADAYFQVQEGVTTSVPNHISITNPEGMPNASYNLVIDTNKRHIYVERENTVQYIVGKLADDKVLTYENHADYKDFVIKNFGTFIDVPKDKFDFVMVSSIADAQRIQKGEIIPPVDNMKFEENVAKATLYYGYINYKCDEWDGGRLFVSDGKMMDARTLDHVYGWMRSPGDDEAKLSVLTETSPGSLIYEGDVAFDNAVTPYLFFTLNNPENRNLAISFASPAYALGMGGLIYEKSSDLIAKDGKMSSAMRFNGLSFILNSVKGTGFIKVKLDLNRMEMTGEMAPENKASVYECVSENSAIDQVVAKSSTIIDGAVKLTGVLNTETGASAEFNFASPEGELIVPASGQGMELSFGEDGVWEGDYVTVTAPARSKSVARKAAAESDAKWSISLPDNARLSYVSMLINESTKKIKVFSSAHKTDDFFITRYNDVYIPQFESCIENIDKLPRLSRKSDGIYQGEVTVPESGQYHIYLTNAFLDNTKGYTGIYGNWDSLNFELSESSDEVSRSAWVSDISPEKKYFSYASNWNVNAPAGKLSITYDNNKNLLTLKSETGLGCDDVTVDNGSVTLRLTIGEGCVMVTANGDADLDFVTATGAVAKHVAVNAGTTNVPLAPGFYVVAGQKIFVR